MVFKNKILYLLMVIIIYSCAPKQVEVVPQQPRKIIPNWLSGISNDSLFLYGVSKVENNSTTSSDSLARGKIIKMIKADFFKYLKKIDQNHDLNFNQIKEIFWNDRLKKISQYVSIYENYNDGKHNYSLARFDKDSYTNAFYEEFAKVDRMNHERRKSIDSVISLDNFKNIAEITNQITNNKKRILKIERKGPMPHNGYRPFLIKKIKINFKDIKITSIKDGIKNYYLETIR